MSIGKSTGKGMRHDKWTMRVKSLACRIRRWMRAGSQWICWGRGDAAGISSSFCIAGPSRVFCIS